MARRCSITGAGVQYGNQVSHSNRKTRRRFLPNIQSISLRSDILNASIQLRIKASTVRTIDINGGLDSYLLSTSNRKLSDEAITLKKRIVRALAKKQEKETA
jgi:large subunit ribosomal protein L28